MTDINNREIIATETADMVKSSNFYHAYMFHLQKRRGSTKCVASPIHFIVQPERQQVPYQEFQEVQDADQAQCCDPHLTAWFKLNQLDATAIEYLYYKIPLHYLFNRKDMEWTQRIRINNNVVSRISKLQIKLNLRLLLLYTPGATSFENWRTVEGEELPTFKQICIRLRHQQDDTELHNALTEDATFMNVHLNKQNKV